MKLYGNSVNLLGKKFGRLEVIEYTDERKHKSIIWLCKCSCGSFKKVKSSDLIRGSVRSCGCLLEEIRLIPKRYLPKGEASFNRLYKNYEINSKRRNICFEITKEEFRKITKQNCYYCEIEPTQEYTSGKTPNGAYVYNGIDRVDNSKGYTLDNVVPCCERCNNLKGGTTILIANKMMKFINRGN